MPRISVVIPAFNAERFLRQTLESAAAQTSGDFEVVVVNDGSRDATRDIAESFGGPVRVINQPNVGMSASRNRGIDSGDSELVALLDSDDLWHPRKLEMQLRSFAQMPSAGFSFTGFDRWHGNDAAPWLMLPRTASLDEPLSGWIYHRLILDNDALPSSLLFRRSAWQQLGPFLCDNQQTDDWEYIVRASREFQYVKLKESFVLYRQVASSLSKRMPCTNVGELMRESLINRFGLASPDGTPVDAHALRMQRFMGRRNFADAHCARGDFTLGLRQFAQLMVEGPMRGHAALSLLMACRRRVLPRT